MLKNFFKVASRNLFRQKAYSLLNLFGLSLGIFCGLLLTLHIREELSYERNFPKHDLIYRMVTTEWSKSSPPLAGEMMKYFPEIKSTARLSDAGTSVLNTVDGKKGECKGYFADSTFVGMFDLKAVAGNPVHALADPYSIVITRSMARRFFGSKDPIGQKMVSDNKYDTWVGAVIEDLPPNTHLKFDYLSSMVVFYKFTPAKWTDNRGWMFGWTYVQFRDKEGEKRAEKRMKDFWTKYWETDADKAEVAAIGATQRFQPLTDIHLKSDLIQEMGPNSSIIYIYIFIAIEVLILVIACINFINLFTTQSLKRLKEVAVRKILGAQRIQLVLQFLGEAFLLTILAGLVAIMLYQLALPFYNSLTGRQITARELLHPDNLLIIGCIVLCTGLLSGLFPALFIAGFAPAASLKGNKLPKSPASLLRKSLVVFQFVTASFLIIATVLVYQQMDLFHNKQLGFDKDQVMVVRLYGNLKDKLLAHPELIKNEFLSNPDILAVGRSTNVIGDDLSVESVTPVDATPGKDYPSVRVFRVDDHYLDVLSIPLKEGRNFSRAYKDSAAFIMNETAVRILGLKNPVGTNVVNNTMGLKGKVIGIVKDFHFASLHNQIEPLVLEYRPEWTENLLVKIRAGKTIAATDFLRAALAKIEPDALFNYGFLDDKITGLYKKEDNMSVLLKVFSVFSILISCLGLFGLAAHAADTRTKEIGIRKVIGASVANLIQLLSRDFIGLVLIGNLVAWPFAWWAVHKWLQDFTYKIEIRWPVFALSFVITLFIAVLTIGFRCLKTARTNPVCSLRSE